MSKKRKAARDPRLETPPGYYLRSADWMPSKEKPASFFSFRDTVIFAFLVVACLIVGAILWIKPPQYISFDADKPYDPAVTAKNMPKQLQKFPAYDTGKFEEISEDDPSIITDEEELPMKDAEEPSGPRTLKSELKKIFHFLLASLRLPIVV